MANESLRSVGTLGALAVLCNLESARAAVVVSTTVVNVPIVVNTSLFLDLDGDSVDDFEIFGNHSHVNAFGLGSNEVATEGSGMATVLGAVNTVDAGLSYQSVATLHQMLDATSPSAAGAFSVGFHFVGQDSLLHYGWLNLNFPNANSISISGAEVVSASWESMAATGVTITAVPEPAAQVAIAGLGLGLWALWRKQKHPVPPCR